MAWNLSDPAFGKDYLGMESPGFFLNRPKPDRGPQFRSSRHDLNILQKLKQFKDEIKFCDVEVKVGENIFQAHKVVLAAQSPYFSSLLNPQIAGDKETILIEHLAPSVFLEFMDFLYSGDIIPKESSFVDLLGLAKQFQVESLTSHCESFISRTLNVSNFVSRLLVCQKYDLKRAANEIIDFGRQNFAVIVKQTEFLCMPPVKFYKLLNILKLGSSDVEIKLGLISHWVGYNTEEREKLVLHLLSGINWTMSPSDVIRFITESENLFTANEFCLFQLMHKLYLSFQQLGPYTNTYEGLRLVYNDVTDTDFPKVLSESETLDNTINFRVTFNDQSSQKRSSDSDIPLKKDACFNTDIDITCFDEVHEIPLLSSCVATSSDLKKTSASIKEELVTTDVIDKEKTVDDNSGKTDVNAEIDLKQSNTTDEAVEEKKQSRRKGRPKKHTKAGDKTVNESACVKKVKAQKKTKSKNVENSKKEKRTIKIKIKSLPPNPVVTDNDDVKTVKEERQENVSKNENSDTDHYLSDNEHHSSDELCNNDDINKFLNNDIPEESKPTLSKRKVRLKGTKSSARRIKQIKDNIQKTKTVDTRPSRMKNRPFIKCTEEGCDYQTKNEKFLKRHVEMVHTLKVMLTCKHCDFSASLMRDLCVHVKQHYTEGPPYKCPEEGCDFQGMRMGLFIRHQMEHKDERPYSCETCHKSFRTENQLSCHKKLHEGRQFVCDVCNKRFTTKGGMQTHRAIHFDNKPYLCDWCGFSTKHQSHLISHRKLHTGDLLKCTFENCSFVTNKKGYMTHHMNAHFNIRNHVCQVCGKSFVVRSKLIRHEKIHLEEKLYKCKSCDYQTSRTDRMKLHIQSHGAHLRRKAGVKFPKVQFDEDFDYSQMYEKVEPSTNSFYNKSLTEEMKTDSHHDNLTSSIMDSVSVAMSTIGSDPVVSSLNAEPGHMPFGQSTYRQLDLLSVAAAGLEQFGKMQGAGFQQSFDQHHSTYEHI